MNVCQLACYYHTNDLYGRLFARLADRGIKQSVVSGRDLQRDTPEHPLLSYHSDRIWDRLDSLWLPRKTRKYVSFINRELDVSQSTLIHAHTLYSDGFAAHALFKEHGVPYMVTVRHTDLNIFARYGKHLNARAATVVNDASQVVFLCHPYRAELEEALHVSIPDEKFHVIPNGMGQFWIDSDQRSLPGIDPGVIRLICVGSITKLKNQAGLIKAVEVHNARRTDDQPLLTLTVVGDHSSAYSSRLKTAHASEHIRFTGPLSPEEVRQHMSNSDIFVLISFKETFGVVYTEAMSMGLPIIYTRGQGIDGWREEGEWGYSCAADSITELLGHILTLGNDTRLSEDEISSVKHQFSWEFIAPEVHRLYELADSLRTTG